MGRLKPEGSTSCLRCLKGKLERAFRQIDEEDAPVLRAYLLRHVQYASPLFEKGSGQFARDPGAGIRAKHCLPPGFNVVAMNDTNPMRFPPIVERSLLAHELGLPFFLAP